MMDSIGKQMKNSINKEVGKNIGKSPDQASDYLKASNDATKDIKETKKVKKKKEPKEATGASASGQYSGPVFSTKAEMPITRSMPSEVREGQGKIDHSKKKIKTTLKKTSDKEHQKKIIKKGVDVSKFGDPVKWQKKEREDRKLPGRKEEKPKKQEPKEATSSSSSGQYSSPKAWAKSFNKKDFRGASKTQIPGGKFVTVKDKCQRFPYCNKGDIKALNIFENERLKTVIKNIEKKHGISENVIKAVIQYELEILEMKKSNKL